MRHKIQVKLNDAEFKYMTDFLTTFSIPLGQPEFLKKCMIHTINLSMAEAQRLQDLEQQLVVGEVDGTQPGQGDTGRDTETSESSGDVNSNALPNTQEG